MVFLRPAVAVDAIALLFGRAKSRKGLRIILGVVEALMHSLLRHGLERITDV